MKGLMLHCGGRIASLEEIAEVETPTANRSHVPVSHLDVIESARSALVDSGYSITDEEHGLAGAGGNGDARYFGILQISQDGRKDRGDYSWTLGIRNSHDKKFPVGFAAGSRAFVCDNTAFSAESTVARKHTRNVRRDLPGAIARAIGGMAESLGLLDTRYDAYKERELRDAEANDILVKLLDNRAIVTRDLAPILHEWRTPKHDEFLPRTAWSLFNGVTETHKAISDPTVLVNRSAALHGTLDTYVGLAPEIIDVEPELAPIEVEAN